MRKAVIVFMMISLISLSGCVSKTSYDELKEENVQLRIDMENIRRERNKFKKELSEIIPAPEMVKVYIEGETTAKVISIIQEDTESDDIFAMTNVVVQFFQSDMYSIKMKTELAKQLEVGEVYCFKMISSTSYEIPKGEYLQYGDEHYAPPLSFNGETYICESFRLADKATETGTSSLRPKFIKAP